MKLIIDIPKDIIESAKSSPNYYPAYHFEKIWRAIAKGIPLPKGHGRLIDADKLEPRDISPEAWYSPMWGFELVDIEDASTIIEADKAESEE